ncbi:alpha/beta hydrolase family protein [Sinomonas mesophila]|uniref:alpha/beta hydrolase family protein n=1 Tax=Sinomonas mesophila TaxID=1531955 RepID=UPI001C37A276|nr:alpha/beta hydrolase [Sinomonas mesophila]
MTSQPPAVVRPRAQDPAVLRYGDHPDQWVELWDQGGNAGKGPARGLVLLVHGGYWQAPYTLDLMRPMAADLAARGWAVANIEYRRDAEGRWPVPEEDVRAAIAAVLGSAWAGRHAGPRVSLGHSVGGQLALLTAEAVDAVVALAPVTDVPRVWREGLGQDAARRYFGASPEEAPGAYAAASPLARLPLGRPALVVQGDADDRVPLGHSLAYAAAAEVAGDAVLLEVHAGADHFVVIDPAWEGWGDVVEWMARVEAERG